MNPLWFSIVAYVGGFWIGFFLGRENGRRSRDRAAPRYVTELEVSYEHDVRLAEYCGPGRYLITRLLPQERGK